MSDAFCPHGNQATADWASLVLGGPSRVQVDGVDLVEAAVDASRLEEEAVVGAGRHGVTPPSLSLQLLQQVEA